MMLKRSAISVPLSRKCVTSTRARLQPCNAGKQAMAATAALVLSLSIQGPALAEKIGEFAASGFVFKDNVEVVAIEDKDVAGVTIYVSDFKRSIVDKLSKDFFSEPSQASLTCAVTGPIVIKDPSKLKDKSGSEVFSEKKSLNLFQDKTLRIRRVYDEKRNALVYVAFSTRLSSASDDGGVTSGRYRTSICAVNIPDAPAPPIVATPVE